LKRPQQAKSAFQKTLFPEMFNMFLHITIKQFTKQRSVATIRVLSKTCKNLEVGFRCFSSFAINSISTKHNSNKRLLVKEEAREGTRCVPSDNVWGRTGFRPKTRLRQTTNVSKTTI